MHPVLGRRNRQNTRGYCDCEALPANTSCAAGQWRCREAQNSWINILEIQDCGQFGYIFVWSLANLVGTLGQGRDIQHAEQKPGTYRKPAKAKQPDFWTPKRLELCGNVCLLGPRGLGMAHGALGFALPLGGRTSGQP